MKLSELAKKYDVNHEEVKDYLMEFDAIGTDNEVTPTEMIDFFLGMDKSYAAVVATMIMSRMSREDQNAKVFVHSLASLQEFIKKEPTEVQLLLNQIKDKAIRRVSIDSKFKFGEDIIYNLIQTIITGQKIPTENKIKSFSVVLEAMEEIDANPNPSNLTKEEFRDKYLNKINFDDTSD